MNKRKFVRAQTQATFESKKRKLFSMQVTHYYSRFHAITSYTTVLFHCKARCECLHVSYLNLYAHEESMNCFLVFAIQCKELLQCLLIPLPPLSMPAISHSWHHLPFVLNGHDLHLHPAVFVYLANYLRIQTRNW